MITCNLSDWDWESESKFPLCEYNGNTIWSRPDDRIEYDGKLYINFNELPENILSELEMKVKLEEDTDIKFLGNMIIDKYLRLVSNFDSITDIVTNIKKDKRIFIKYNGTLYYVLDYDSLTELI